VLFVLIQPLNNKKKTQQRPETQTHIIKSFPQTLFSKSKGVDIFPFERKQIGIHIERDGKQLK